MAGTGRVCVTGAGGFTASWLVKLLLSKGYTVHGTVRDPGDEKNAHLKMLENATQSLQLFKADLLDYDGLCAAIAGCEGVFHTACPVLPRNMPNPEVEMVAPALDGTLNVLKASSMAKVKRVVVISSVVSVFMIPDASPEKIMDEACWSDKEFCKTTGNWYCFSKTIAEEKAFEYAKESGLDVVTVCPSLIIGPMLQPTVNASNLAIIKILRGERESMEDIFQHIVDVRDVANALLLVYEKPEATGRHICTSREIKVHDFIDMLKIIYPNFKYPKISTEVERDVRLSSEKLQQLGWNHRTLEETLADTVEHFLEAGILGND